MQLIRLRCWQSTVIKALSFAVSTLVAQVVIGTRCVVLLGDLPLKLALRFPNRRAYALSGFNRKLLAALLSIGATYFVLVVALIHSIVVTGRSHSVPRPPGRRFLTKYQLDHVQRNHLKGSEYV